MKIILDRHWIKNTGWRRQGKLRRGFAIGPFIVLLKEG